MTPRLLLLLSLFVAAGALRLPALNSSTILGERQYRSALITRSFYYESLDAADPWKLRIARLNREREGRLEPPIMERTVALLYRLAGGEHLWIPRLLAVLFWLAGGVFLYRLATRFVPPEGAVVGTSYYLLNPMGVSVSSGFLPDPLMIALFMLALLGSIRFHERPNRARLAFAAGASAMAVLVKPFCLFAILGAVIALAIHRHGFRRFALAPSFIALVAAVLTPAVGYYGYGMLTQAASAGGDVAAWDSLARSASVSFVPHLLLERGFWTGWVSTALSALRPMPVIAALLGLALLRGALGFPLVAGITGGYLAFCVAFTYLTPFAGHYHLQMVVVVALGLGALASELIRQLRSTIQSPYSWAFPLVAGLLAIWLGARAIRQEMTPAIVERPELAREVGQLIGHSDRVVHVATFYGKPLQYHGEFYGTWWPSASGDAPSYLKQESWSIEERLGVLGFRPEYFVITDFTGYQRRHADLRAFLQSNCRVLAESSSYLIYNECSGAAKAAAGRAPLRPDGG